MRTVILLLGVLISTSALAAPVTFKVSANDGSPVPHAVISSGGPITGTGGLAIMDQVDKAFSPYVLAVGKGTKVDFPNSDQIRHHVYSFSEAKPFELRLYSGRPEAPIEFPDPGVVVVGCNIHDNMVGYIYISPREHWSITGADGTTALEVTDGEVHVWFPSLSLDAQRELTFNLGDLSQTGDQYEIRLDIRPPSPFPQAIQTTDRDRFKRFLD